MWNCLQHDHLGQESYPINTEPGGTICWEVALMFGLRLLIFTTKNFIVGFTAPAYEKTITELVLIIKKKISVHKFKAIQKWLNCAHKIITRHF